MYVWFLVTLTYEKSAYLAQFLARATYESLCHSVCVCMYVCMSIFKMFPVAASKSSVTMQYAVYIIVYICPYCPSSVAICVLCTLKLRCDFEVNFWWLWRKQLQTRLVLQCQTPSPDSCLLVLVLWVKFKCQILSLQHTSFWWVTILRLVDDHP